MLEQYHFLKCEEQFFSSNIINSPYRGLKFLLVHIIRTVTSIVNFKNTGYTLYFTAQPM